MVWLGQAIGIPSAHGICATRDTVPVVQQAIVFFRQTANHLGKFPSRGDGLFAEIGVLHSGQHNESVWVLCPNFANGLNNGGFQLIGHRVFVNQIVGAPIQDHQIGRQDFGLRLKISLRAQGRISGAPHAQVVIHHTGGLVFNAHAIQLECVFGFDICVGDLKTEGVKQLRHGDLDHLCSTLRTFFAWQRTLPQQVA